MGNIISADKLGDQAHLRMSSGAMTVLASVLLLAGSDLAKQPWEIALVRFLAERDQEVFGSGTVGFDLADIAWTRDGFPDQKAFVLEIIDLARRRHRWETLSYEPAFASAQLDELRALIERWSVEHVEDTVWALRLPTERPLLCEHHRVYVHAEGCLLCHDMGA